MPKSRKKNKEMSPVELFNFYVTVYRDFKDLEKYEDEKKMAELDEGMGYLAKLFSSDASKNDCDLKEALTFIYKRNKEITAYSLQAYRVCMYYQRWEDLKDEYDFKKLEAAIEEMEEKIALKGDDLSGFSDEETAMMNKIKREIDFILTDVIGSIELQNEDPYYMFMHDKSFRDYVREKQDLIS